jgi:hypothetical protein
MTMLPPLACPGLLTRFFKPSAVSSAASIAVGTPGTVREKLLGFPLGRSLRLGALGLGLFLARPPM